MGDQPAVSFTPDVHRDRIIGFDRMQHATIPLADGRSLMVSTALNGASVELNIRGEGTTQRISVRENPNTGAVISSSAFSGDARGNQRPQLSASDADRVFDKLMNAAADGRLTQQEAGEIGELATQLLGVVQPSASRRR